MITYNITVWYDYIYHHSVVWLPIPSSCGMVTYTITVWYDYLYHHRVLVVACVTAAWYTGPSPILNAMNTL